MKNRGLVDPRPVTVDQIDFTELSSIDGVVRLAEDAEWLILRVPAEVLVTEDRKRVDETKPERERYIHELARRLPMCKVWDSGFLPTESALPLARGNTPGSLIAGTTRISVRRVVAEQELEEALGLLTSAAIEYRRLANILMGWLSRQLDADIAEFARCDSWHSHRQSGRLMPQTGGVDTDDHWDYFFHGRDCAFSRTSSGVKVEARLGVGDEFGVLDPGFFMEFIYSALSERPDYEPLDAILRNWWENARRALDFMEKRGIVRQLFANPADGSGWVVASVDRL